MTHKNKVVLVNENDEVLGEMEKLEAHKKGYLHRAFSVFIFNENNEMLLQQRAEHKYHGANLWTNACCSHPQINENVLESATERLQFEMGLHCKLNYLLSFIYKTPVENNLIEHELDYVFIGYTHFQPTINSTEVKEYKWIDLESLKIEIIQTPEKFTFWFKYIFPKIMATMQNNIRVLGSYISK